MNKHAALQQLYNDCLGRERQLQARLQQAEARVAEISEKADRLSFAIVHSLTDDQQEPFSSQFADLQDAIVANSSKPWLLRKQAEAVEPAIRAALRDLGNANLFVEDIDQFAYCYAQRFRQQADELDARKAGGEHG